MNKHSLFTFVSIVAVTLTFVGYLQHPTDQRSRSASGTLPAFPGAEGFGATTVGGRGGKVLEVSNVNDSGVGSLRECVNNVGPRTCVFRIGGTITLSSRLSIKNPFITIVGQTAPGGGIQIRGHMVEIATHDVIMRYLKLRPGDTAVADATGIDALFLNGTGTNEVYNVVVDHTSMTWGPDTGGVSMSVNVHDVTIQNSISGEGLYLSNHAEGTVANGGHSKGIVISDLQAVYGATHPSRITLHHNLVTTADERNPSLQLPENIDIVNNVFYNWGNLGAFGDVYSLNLIKNYFIKGPKTTKLLAWEPNAKTGSPRNSSVYEQGNIVEGFTTVRGGSSSVYTTTRFSPYSISTEQTPQEAYTKIVAEVGANLPLRDSVDQRIINNLTNRIGEFVNGVNAPEPRISWPTLAAGTASVDSDHDGMSDNWEQTNFGNLNRGAATNSASDFDNDGYTDLEEFLNGTNPKDIGNITQSPTAPSPTVSLDPQSTSLNLTVLLHGIGKGGDNVNPNGTGNMNPLRPQRPVSIELFDSNNAALSIKTGTITFNTTSGTFTGVVDVGAVPSGPYIMKLGVRGYLKRLVPGIVQITSNSQNSIPQRALITGDSNNDNVINILDYNMIIDCFSDIAPAKNCSDGNKKLAADLTDDGKVNQFDYNLFLRELSVQTGE